MTPESKSPRTGAAAPLAALLAAVVGLVAFTGCQTQETADKEKGKALFTAKCGTCHTLKEAGTTTKIGPNLDAAFAESRAQGTDSDTIEGVVRHQVEFPRPASPKNTDVYMPRNLVKGKDVEDVAAYVGSVAGVRGIKPDPLVGGEGPGAQVFATQGCASCHTLQAAGSSGTTGPNLDESLKGKDGKYIQQAIEDPNAVVAKGFGKGIMPPYKGKIQGKDLQDLVKFLLDNVKGTKK